jgi:hypothetical protein
MPRRTAALGQFRRIEAFGAASGSPSIAAESMRRSKGKEGHTETVQHVSGSNGFSRKQPWRPLWTPP